ncbi:MAG TPA: aspartate-semialdehyde dehydrogenase [Woeseiaceae bacterium]
MSKTFNVAVVGATGLVGKAMLEILAEREFPLGRVFPVASERSIGRAVEFGDEELHTQELADFDFSQVDIALFSAGAAVSAEHAPRAAAAGCVVIDNTSHFRRDADVPLVVPEVNPEAIEGFRKKGIIANPNCSTIQMLVALKPIYDAVGIERINVATYQAASGAGRELVEDMVHQSAKLLNGRRLELKGKTRQIAFNVIPHIDDFQDNRYTREEMKMHWETQKILGDEHIGVNATAVRVPVFYGHSEAVHIETREKISPAEVCKLLRKAPGVKLLDGVATGRYPTPVFDASGKDAVFVGRVREDFTHPRGIDLWIVADNIRKGAALNSVQIAEILAKKYL